MRSQTTGATARSLFALRGGFFAGFCGGFGGEFTVWLDMGTRQFASFYAIRAAEKLPDWLGMTGI
jgi:hypothetical protein